MQPNMWYNSNCQSILNIRRNYKMIELQIAGLKANIEAKLEAIRMSNPLYYHQFKKRYNELLKKYKTNDYLEDMWVELEELLGAVDDVLRGAD